MSLCVNENDIRFFPYNNGGDLRKINGGFAWLPNVCNNVLP